MNKHLPIFENETSSVLSFENHDLVLNGIVPCLLFHNIFTQSFQFALHFPLCLPTVIQNLNRTQKH